MLSFVAKAVLWLAYAWLALVLTAAVLLISEGEILSAAIAVGLFGSPAAVLAYAGRRRVPKRSGGPDRGDTRLGKAGRAPFLKDDGAYSQEVVGESFHQSALSHLAGQKTSRSKQVHCSAVLALEDDNSKDSSAVVVLIEEMKVGHLPKLVAPTFRRQMGRLPGNLTMASTEAKIVGGWKDKDSEGHLGVSLDLIWPLELIETAEKPVESHAGPGDGVS